MRRTRACLPAALAGQQVAAGLGVGLPGRGCSTRGKGGGGRGVIQGEEKCALETFRSGRIKSGRTARQYTEALTRSAVVTMTLPQVLSLVGFKGQWRKNESEMRRTSRGSTLLPGAAGSWSRIDSSRGRTRALCKNHKRKRGGRPTKGLSQAQALAMLLTTSKETTTGARDWDSFELHESGWRPEGCCRLPLVCRQSSSCVEDDCQVL